MSNNIISLKRNAKNQVEETKEFVKSKTWINVGIQQADGQFISLPMNIPFDGMKEAQGSSEIAAKKNALMKRIRQLVDELEPGEARTINLSVQIFRKAEDKEEEIDENFEDLLNSIN